MRVLIDGPASEASFVQLDTARSSVAFSPAWMGLAHVGHGLKPPVPRRAGRTHGPVGQARSDGGKQARAQHRRGRLRVVRSERPHRLGGDDRIQPRKEKRRARSVEREPFRVP